MNNRPKVSKGCLLDVDVAEAIDAKRAELRMSFTEWLTSDPRIAGDSVTARVEGVRPRRRVKCVEDEKHAAVLPYIIRDKVGPGRLPPDYRTGRKALHIESIGPVSRDRFPDGVRFVDLSDNFLDWVDGFFSYELEPVILEETAWGWNVFSYEGRHIARLFIHREEPFPDFAPGYYHAKLDLKMRDGSFYHQETLIELDTDLDAVSRQVCGEGSVWMRNREGYEVHAQCGALWHSEGTITILRPATPEEIPHPA